MKFYISTCYNSYDIVFYKDANYHITSGIKDYTIAYHGRGCNSDSTKRARIALNSLPIKKIKRSMIARRMKLYMTIKDINVFCKTLATLKDEKITEVMTHFIMYEV